MMVPPPFLRVGMYVHNTTFRSRFTCSLHRCLLYHAAYDHINMLIEKRWTWLTQQIAELCPQLRLQLCHSSAITNGSKAKASANNILNMLAALNANLAAPSWQQQHTARQTHQLGQWPCSGLPCHQWAQHRGCRSQWVQHRGCHRACRTGPSCHNPQWGRQTALQRGLLCHMADTRRAGTCTTHPTVTIELNFVTTVCWELYK